MAANNEHHFAVGEFVKCKKAHPCGGNVWEILRVGADFRIKCAKCGRMLMLTRVKFEKSVKEKLEPK